jgi:hypothetical protein
MGFSHDWGNLEKFAQEALALAGEYLHVTNSPQELPPWSS